MSQIKIGSWTYNQIQINGEQITTNVSFKNCLIADRNPTEVHIRNIPFTMYEDKLIRLFETIGVVAQLRLMMNHSGKNRGFGYVIFVNADDGHRAIALLNNIQVLPWCRLEVIRSRNTRKLWMGNIDNELDVATVVEMILEKVDPLEISIGQRYGRRVFELKFCTHREAAISRKTLTSESFAFGPYTRIHWDYHGDIYV